jgi:hypothetical protein
VLNLNDWNRLYIIEENLHALSYTQDDVKFLIKLIYKLNGNIIDPKAHNKIQQLIDRIEIPDVDIDFNKKSKQIFKDYMNND